MLDSINLQMTQRGVLVLPKTLRQAYNLKPGDNFTLLDLGGVFVLSPRSTEVDDLSARITKALIEKGATLEGMLATLREERERYGNKD